MKKKLALGKKVIAQLNLSQMNQVYGGDAPTYGNYCTASGCDDSNFFCFTVNTCSGDCPSGNTPSCTSGTICGYASDLGHCFTNDNCSHGNCSDGCPYSHGDYTC